VGTTRQHGNHHALLQSSHFIVVTKCALLIFALPHIARLVSRKTRLITHPLRCKSRASSNGCFVDINLGNAVLGYRLTLFHSLSPHPRGMQNTTDETLPRWHQLHMGNEKSHFSIHELINQPPRKILACSVTGTAFGRKRRSPEAGSK
jgi:hypothetical protein